MGNWAHIARRIRVPVGFAFAAFYLWLARPDWRYLAAGAVLVVAGLALRAYASGYLRKNSALTTRGPYAHTRNPLYLGSVIMASGFALAAHSFWIAVVMLAIFVVIYLPVIGFEEAFLRSLFLHDFDDYARQVPRLFPRLSPGERQGVEGFSFGLYLKNREYNALVGAAAILAALILKLLWFSH